VFANGVAALSGAALSGAVLSGAAPDGQPGYDIRMFALCEIESSLGP
jgi:hypothetical protein